jgi:hypothetical protein
MFYEIFADEGDNAICNVEENNKLSPDLKPLTTGSVLKIRVFFSPVP